jgi:hypothetical protein
MLRLVTRISTDRLLQNCCFSKKSFFLEKITFSFKKPWSTTEKFK